MIRETEQRDAPSSATNSTQVAWSSRETDVSAAIRSSESSTSAVDTPSVCAAGQLRRRGAVVAGVSAGAGSRATFVDGDVRVTSARLTGFVVNELVFPAAHTMQLDPEDGYVGVVLEGACEKTFVHGSRSLGAGSAFTMPAGAFHSTAVGRCATKVVVLHPVEGEAPAVPWPRLLRAFREARGAGPLGAGWRLAGELHARDDAWALAAEGLCLELISGYIREERSTRRANGSRAWLEPVRERLHAQLERAPVSRRARGVRGCASGLPRAELPRSATGSASASTCGASGSTGLPRSSLRRRRPSRCSRPRPASPTRVTSPVPSSVTPGSPPPGIAGLFASEPGATRRSSLGPGRCPGRPRGRSAAGSGCCRTPRWRLRCRSRSGSTGRPARRAPSPLSNTWNQA